jgi:hypothetical protein
VQFTWRCANPDYLEKSSDVLQNAESSFLAAPEKNNY